MAYQMYRSTTLGVCLQRTLDDFIQDGSLNPQLAQKVLVAFDKSINRALQYRARNKTTFKADKLLTYRFCDNVWTFVMEGVEFRDATSPIEGVVNRVKFVACDGRATSLLPSQS